MPRHPEVAFRSSHREVLSPTREIKIEINTEDGFPGADCAECNENLEYDS